MRKQSFPAEVKTLYFGGGTPSLLTQQQLEAILGAMGRLPSLEEFTLEVNPEDVTADHLSFWRAAGINRLSIGIQAFDDDMLKWMNRKHTALEAKQSVAMARQAGFENLTIDLIFGLPGQDKPHWQKMLHQALDMEVPHLSLYGLTIEERTVLHKQMKEGRVREAEDSDELFLMAHEVLTNAGYEHYEISNYSLPGYRSRHNSAYWQGSDYVGIGPSAHGLSRITRYWNVRSNTAYVQALSKDILPEEREEREGQSRWNEWVMVRLRTMEGLPLHMLTADQKTQVRSALKSISSGWYMEQNDRISLTPEGMLWCDRIASEMMMV